MLFNFGFEKELIDKPVRFGQNFKRPSKKSMRIDRSRKQKLHGLKTIQAAELSTLIEQATVPLRAMILLGVNGGLGASDLAQVTIRSIDNDWLNFPRVKTATARRIPLWPETQAALAEALDHRPNPKSAADADLLFLTKYGQRWVRNLTVRQQQYR